jgi:hypothetical protein
MEMRRVYDDAPQFVRRAPSTRRRDLELIQEHHEELLREADRQRLVRKLRAARRKVHPLLRSRAQTTPGALKAQPASPSAGPAR